MQTERLLIGRSNLMAECDERVRMIYNLSETGICDWDLVKKRPGLHRLQSSDFGIRCLESKVWINFNEKRLILTCELHFKTLDSKVFGSEVSSNLHEIACNAPP